MSREHAKKLGFGDYQEYLEWWMSRHHYALLLAIEVAGRETGGWANCHEIADVLRKAKDTSRTATDPAYLSMSILSPMCRPYPPRNEEPLLEKRRRIAAGLVDYRLTEDGRKLLKRGMTA